MSAAPDDLVVDALRPADVPGAAAIFVDSFPAIVGLRFGTESHALAFHGDLFELLRRVHGPTFLAAREGGGLVGFVLVTKPGARLWPALARGLLGLRLAARAARGRYGFSPRFLHDAVRTLLGGGGLRGEWSRAPCLYAIAVARGHTGRGTGSVLLERAKDLAGESMWLYVERENEAGIRFYERAGFRRIESEPGRHVMGWERPRAQGGADGGSAP